MSSRISSFYGIAVYMHWVEHGPAHFHARYQGFEAKIAIDTLTVVAGELPPRALRLVREWGSQHELELLASWRKVREHVPPDRIDPL